MSIDRHLARPASVLVAVLLASACGGGTSSDPAQAVGCVTGCGGTDPTQPTTSATTDGGGDPTVIKARSTDGEQNGSETDVDCGGPDAPRCAVGRKCALDRDCEGACNYAKRCVESPSCKPHLGGDTCGKGEVGQPGAVHESCCKTLPVTGYSDPMYKGKKVYLDKYEITAGRVRAFLLDMSTRYSGAPNVREWIAKNPPAVWDPSWNKFLPADVDGDELIVDRRLVGDPRGTWPGAPPVPPADEPRKTGTDFQFNGSLFVYLHGNNCSTHAPTAFGFPTWFYPANVLAKMGPQYPPRADGKDVAGTLIPASEHLEVKSMNCITNALLQAFCHWDGGQLATSDVLDYVTASPPELGSKPGCGTQVGTEDPPRTDASQKGGRCAELALVNATYDAGAALPEPNHPLNIARYMFPAFAETVMHDKAWQIAAPGRGTSAAAGEAVDQVRISPGDEPWMDLAGNLTETVLDVEGGRPTKKFTLRFRGIGYQSARSKLNFDPKWDDDTKTLARIERPEAKAAFAGGRCMRFR